MRQTASELLLQLDFLSNPKPKNRSQIGPKVRIQLRRGRTQMFCLWTVAYAKKKSFNFASASWWHLKVGMETPENDFQIYRPIRSTPSHL